MQNKEIDNICINPFRLFMENVPVQTTFEDLEKLFTTASEVVYMPNRCLAHMIYKSKEEQRRFSERLDDIEIHGAKMTVLYVDNTPNAIGEKKNYRKLRLLRRKRSKRNYRNC
ncbi:hypothetical protein C7M84_023055 [Penaeus vannamei]|uniref:RRM domain-containing protein n=1 Tax=Penaeus vannamei TaxID=6689 RepID=A0A3R7QYR3_PENVA|nr:hypothetical protein C7M84_023055 [Penaeus vannamei]